MTQRAHGDFTGLAENYSKFRPGYSLTVRDIILSLVGKPAQEIAFADVGAGTGIWTRIVAEAGVRKVVAVEPNADMYKYGRKDSGGAIDWHLGSGEETGLPDSSFDLVSMASSFHWVDFDRGTKEFGRILRKGGRFAALWNPRVVNLNPFTKRVEDELHRIVPTLRRVSSGNSDFTASLTDRLRQVSWFDDVIYVEGTHTIVQSRDAYIGVWRSVNDVRVQAGEERFARFLDFIEREIQSIPMVEVTYLTRAWVARRV